MTHDATDDRTADPRRPRGPRRWPWLVVLVLAACVAYVGGYGWLRITDRIGRVSAQDITNDIHIGFIMSDDPRLDRLFRPCIAVERWWRAR